MVLGDFKGLILKSPSLEGTETEDVGRDLNDCQDWLSPPFFADENTEPGGSDSKPAVELN